MVSSQGKLQRPGQLKIGQAWVYRSIRHQLIQIGSGGPGVLLRKSLTVLGVSLAVVPVLALRALRPLVLVRFGGLHSARIGDLANDPEYYLCQRDTGIQEAGAVDLFYYKRQPVCNRQLKVMADRTLNVHRYARWLDRVNRSIPGGQRHVINIIKRDADHFSEIHELLSRTSVHLSFNPEEESRGSEALRQMGIPEGSSFVCFHARDSAYLETLYPDKHWGYHDYRDTSVHNYVPAAEELANRGYFAVRMGSVVKEALRTGNPRIIDYATNGCRTDFLDVFLSAKCRFFIGSSAGLDSVSNSFRRPIACANHIPLQNALTWGPNDSFIPKKLRSREMGRFLTFREVIESGAGSYSRAEQYEQAGIDVLENSPQEITALVVEMDERLDGRWQTTAEDEELQRRFWSAVKLDGSHGHLLPHVGGEFLRQNQGLLN